MTTVDSSLSDCTVELYRTDNGGESWSKIVTGDDTQIPMDGVKTGITLLNDSVGFINSRFVNSSPMLYVTKDRRLNWDKINILPDSDPSLVYLTEPPAQWGQDKLTSFITAENERHKGLQIVASINRGASWDKQSTMAMKIDEVYSFDVVEEKCIWLSVGDTLYQSSDLKSWKPVAQASTVLGNVNPDAAIPKVSFVSASVGCIVIL